MGRGEDTLFLMPSFEIPEEGKDESHSQRASDHSSKAHANDHNYGRFVGHETLHVIVVVPTALGSNKVRWFMIFVTTS